MKTRNLNAPKDHPELYEVYTDAAFDGDGDAPCCKPVLFPARFAHNHILNFLGRPEVGGA
jgi:hypothetical protein